MSATINNFKRDNMSDNIDFRVDYSKINVLDVFNDDEIKYPLVLSIPHCGTVFPEEFLKAVRPDVQTLRKNEDIFVYDLLKPAIDEAKITAVKKISGLINNVLAMGSVLFIKLLPTVSQFMPVKSLIKKLKNGLKMFMMSITKLLKI